MDNLTIVRLCAEAMGLPFREVGGEIQFRVPSSRGLNDWVTYRPLHDDAAAMALVKRFNMSVYGSIIGEPWEAEIEQLRDPPNKEYPVTTVAHATETDINRAICTAVARLQQAKQK